MTDLTGSSLNDYRVLRRLGRGAMAEVYLAEQRSLARQVALKVLTADLASQPAYVERFKNEARAAAALVHANIVQVYEVGQCNGSHFIAQEYVPGKNLAEWMHRHGRVEPGRVLDILRQVAAALCKAQERSIVHRDVKPENIMLGHSGEVKVADFGLARVTTDDGVNRTQAGMTMGTPLYMSPEQIEGRPVDSRSDIYSLGVTAYHMLSGEPPFQGDTPLAVAVQHLNKPPTPLAERSPDAPPALVALVERMMAKRPEDRFDGPQELLSELRNLAKQAAEQGWAEGPENWSLGDLAAGGTPHFEATQQLEQLMRGTRALQVPRFNRRRAVWACVAAALVGVGTAVAFRQPFVLEGDEPQVLSYDTPLAQLFHAKMVDTPGAWQAVLDRHPTADRSIHYQAMQGLARFYLREGNYRAALPYLQELADVPQNYRVTRAFALVGLTVAHAELGNLDAARRARQLLPLTDIELLEHDRELVERFRMLDL